MNKEEFTAFQHYSTFGIMIIILFMLISFSGVTIKYLFYQKNDPAYEQNGAVKPSQDSTQVDTNFYRSHG